MDRGIYRTVSTITTQVIVDPYDEAFYTPTKVLGRYMNVEKAITGTQEGKLCCRRTWQKDSPYRCGSNPVSIVEIVAIKASICWMQIGLSVACGGGGIPVLEQDHRLKVQSAVIEKDDSRKDGRRDRCGFTHHSYKC